MNRFVERSLLPFVEPHRIAKKILSRVSGLNLRTRIDFDLLPYPQYAYGLYYAARQAAALGLPGVSAIEFGVAGGNGLVALENAAAEIEKDTGIRIVTLGFDSKGLPPPLDYRDLPYAWQRGFFEMNEEKLRARLKRSRLILGDVAVTMPELPAHIDGCPIGFISFDMDYYSSTKVALVELGKLPDASLLPRVYCYFDDIFVYENEIQCEYVGELLAIDEFNREHERQKLARISGLYHRRRLPSVWNDQMYVLRRFGHPAYCTYVGDTPDKQLPLR